MPFRIHCKIQRGDPGNKWSIFVSPPYDTHEEAEKKLEELKESKTYSVKDEEIIEG